MNPGVQRFQKRMLQVMLAVAVGLLLWGLSRLLLDGITHEAARAAFAELHSPKAILVGALRAEPVPLLCLGIAVLVVTPFLRLLVLIVDFMVQRDWMYVAMSAVVGMIVLASFFLRLH